MFAVEERLADYERWRATRGRDRPRASAERARPDGDRLGGRSGAARRSTRRSQRVRNDRDRRDPRRREPAARARGSARWSTPSWRRCRSTPATRIVARTAETQARIIAATSGGESRRGRRGRAAVLRHELMARAGAARALKRETPVTWVQKDGTLIEGVLDLAFDEGGATIVVDFKTDHELSAGETRYRAQLLQYVTAVSRATGRPASGVLFRV